MKRLVTGLLAILVCTMSVPATASSGSTRLELCTAAAVSDCQSALVVYGSLTTMPMIGATNSGSVTRIIDPTLCPILVAIQGKYVGVVVTGGDGDITINEVYYWDCPPYTN